jgi:phosphatidylinositol alpha-1,6-mannosyltransferase
MTHLFVTNDFPPKHGGIQTLLWELWRRLPPESFSVLTTPHEDAPAFDAEQPFPVVRTHEAVLLPTPMLRNRIDDLAHTMDAGLVMIDPVLPLGALAMRLRTPYAVFMHGSELLSRLPGGDALAGRVLRGAQHVVAAGTYPASETRRLTRGAEPPITIIPCGVDSTRFRPLDAAEKIEARRRFGLPVDKPLVVGLSRLVQRKGFDVLIQAVERMPDVHVAVGGAGRDAARLAGLAHERTHLVGRVADEDLPAFYGCGDAFSMLCHDRWGGLEKEGFGVVFLEAAACGVPQVAGRSGGSADAVADGVTGVVVDAPRDVDAVVRALERVLEPATNAAMAAASRRRAVEEYDYDLLAARLREVLGA